MADESQDLTPEAATPANASADAHAVRRRTITFLIIFLTSVSVLLVGYQFAVDTSPNRAYLYFVAKHTAWALGLVGERAELEPRRQMMDTARARATLDAWKRGEPAPESIERQEPNAEPLTAWESWYYRSRLLQEQGNLSLHNEGPLVQFIDKRSVQRQYNDLNRELSTLRRDESIPPDVKSDRVQAMEAELEALRVKRENLPKNNDGQPIDPNREFTFRVVSECGAIEAMAIFFSAIIAFPTRWWKRILGTLIGIPLLYLVNIMRLTCLGYIGAWDNGGEIFSFAHEYVWQGLYIIFVVAIWLLWVEILVRRID